MNELLLNQHKCLVDNRSLKYGEAINGWDLKMHFLNSNVPKWVKVWYPNIQEMNRLNNTVRQYNLDFLKPDNTALLSILSLCSLVFICHSQHCKELIGHNVQIAVVMA